MTVGQSTGHPAHSTDSTEQPGRRGI